MVPQTVFLSASSCGSPALRNVGGKFILLQTGMADDLPAWTFAINNGKINSKVQRRARGLSPPPRSSVTQSRCRAIDRA
jgi:hypothetical protein